MKTTTYFLILFALYCAPVKAQKTELPIPDSLGKTLAGVFLQKEDLSKMPIFPTDKQMDELNEIVGFGQPIATDAASMQDDEASFNQVLESWKMLLHLAQIKKINAGNTKYFRTYFTKNDIPVGDKPADHYGVYVLFKHTVPNQAAQTIAVRFDLLWRSNKWLLFSVDRDFYNYKGKSGSKSDFRPKGWSESVQLTGKAPAFSGSASAKNSAWTKEGTYVTDPAPFIKQVVKHLAAQKPVNETPNLISVADFKRSYQPDVEAMVNQLAKNQKSMSASHLKELKQMQNMIKSDPESLYKQYITNDMASLEEYLTSVGFKTGNVDSVGYEITNFDYEVWTEGKVLMTGNAVIQTSNGTEAIRMKAGWLDGKWQLIYVQPFAYGISRAE